MESFLTFLICFVLSLSILVNLVFLIAIPKMLRASKKVLSSPVDDMQSIMLRRIDEIFDTNKTNYSDLRQLLEPASTMLPPKTNNWDSVRTAFKGPVRVEINERN